MAKVSAIPGNTIAAMWMRPHCAPSWEGVREADGRLRTAIWPCYLNTATMGIAPTLASASLPPTAATTTVLGQTTDGYSQLRPLLPE